MWKGFSGTITAMQDYAQTRFNHVKSCAAKRRKEMQTRRFPSHREVTFTSWLYLWLTHEALLTPVACTFPLNIGTACNLNLYSHGDISRNCGKSWEEKKYLNKIFSGTNIELTAGSRKRLLCKICEKCIKPLVVLRCCYLMKKK